MDARAVLSELALALRLARRELRGGIKGFGVFLTCLALGVGAVAAVGELSALLDHSLRTDAKVILGGDLEIRKSHVPLSDDAVAFLQERGEVVKIAQLRGMSHVKTQDGAEPRASLVELKAVSEGYPLYGVLTLRDGADMNSALAAVDGVPGALVDIELLERLELKPGDTLSVGAGEYRINGVIEREPDRPARFFKLGPRLLVRHDTLEQTQLLRPGSVVFHIYLFKPDDHRMSKSALDRLKTEFSEKFPDSALRIRDYTDAGLRLKRFMENMTLYLTLVGLLSLLVGGIGVANGVRGYLAEKELSIAAMKCLGAPRRLVQQIYLIQTLVLSLVGCFFGVLAGLALAWFSAYLALPLLGLSVPGVGGFAFGPLAAALGCGVLTTLIFTLWPLSAAGQISPARLFRGYADLESRRPTKRIIAVVGALVLMLFSLTLFYAGMRGVVAGFAVAVLLGVLLFRGIAALIIRLAARLPRARNPRLRQAISNLHRPGNHTVEVVFSLGLGLSALAAVTLADGNMQLLITRDMPEKAPEFFFIDIPDTERDTFRDKILSVGGVTRFESQPSIRGRIVGINGTPVEEVKVSEEAQWAVRSDRGLTYAATPPEGTEVTAGAWWREDYHGPPQICLTADLAKGFGVDVGDTLTLNILGREITPKIACLREVDWSTLALNHAIVFAPGALERAPHSFIATVYTDDARPEAGKAVFRLVTKQFPNVVAIYIKDVLTEVTRIMGAIGLAIRAAALITLVTGLLVLAETFRANLKARYYDSVVFKVLGATQKDIVLMLLMEYFLLGAATAAAAGILGAAGAYAFITWVVRRSFELMPMSLLAVCSLGALASLGLGLLGLRAVLRRKAWPVLRNE